MPDKNGTASGTTKRFEADDPYELRFVMVPNDEDESAESMAVCVVEELALLGMTREQVFTVFENPFYVGPHAIYKAEGAEYVQALIDTVFGRFQPSENWSEFNA